MKYFLLLIFWVSSYFAYAQVGKAFPKIETERISGEKVNLPAAFSGNYTIVGIGMGRKAEEALRTWQTPIYNTFIAKTGFMDDMYAVDVFFLPVFTGASRAAKGKVVKKLKENNEALVIDHVYVYSGSREPFDAIGVRDKSEPYFLLINDKNQIVYVAKGSFKQFFLDEITDILNGT